MGYRYFNVRVNSVNDASILCKNFVKFGPVTPELTELTCICERQVRHSQKLAHLVEYRRIYWTDFRNLFIIIMKALYVQMMDLYFIYQFFKGRCHPNNVAEMLSTPTDTTCIRCTSATKRIAMSWSICAH